VLQFLVLFVFFMPIVLLLSTGNILAQRSLSWSAPTNISRTLTQSSHPLMAIDPSGRVHVSWVEYLGTDYDMTESVVMYTNLFNGIWTDPVDVLTPSSIGNLETFEMIADSYDSLVLVWRDTDSINVSTVPAASASNARSWNTTKLEMGGGFSGASIVSEEGGALHLVYVRNTNELVYLFSHDRGQTWSDPNIVTTADRANQAIQYPCIIVGRDNMLYVSWTLNTAAANWGPHGVWFTSSNDEGALWSTPVEIASGLGYGWSSLFVDHADRLSVAWVGNLLAGGRYQRWSLDRGQTWDMPVVIGAPDVFSGYAGPITLISDSGGTLHAVFSGRGRGREGIWHSVWVADKWSEPESLSVDQIDAQVVSADIFAGSWIHTVWVEYESDDIWYSGIQLNTPVIFAATPIPLVIGLKTPTLEPALQETVTSSVSPASVSPISTIPLDAGTPISGNSGIRATLFGVVPAMIFITFAVIWSLRLRHRK